MMSSLRVLLAAAFALQAASAFAQQPAPPKGTLERITVHGRALEGNLEGDSPDRPVVVYLPPSYARTRRGATRCSTSSTATRQPRRPTSSHWPFQTRSIAPLPPAPAK